MISIDVTRIERMFLRLRGLRTQIERPAGIMKTVAEGVEFQTRARIHLEKTDPSGKKWAPWSLRYARTRDGARHSLLKDTWDMVDEDMHSRSDARSAVVYNTAPYAGFLQTGTRRMPARPFLGLSAENIRDMEGWLGPAIEQLAQQTLGGGRE